MVGPLNATLLIVEDDTFTCSVLCSYCGQKFKKVLSAHCAKEALEIYIEHHPDFILTDIELPDENGLALIKRIRDQDERTHIFVLSGYATEEYLLEAVKLRLEDFIKKPINSLKLDQFFEQCSKKMMIAQRVLSHHKKISYCSNRKVLYVNGGEFYLTHMEINLLELLLSNNGKIVSYAVIEANLYTNKVFGKDALRTLMNRLRKKIGAELIFSHPDIGYRLEVN